MLVLTREIVRPHMARVMVAPITSIVRGLSTEVPVGVANGVAGACVVSCDKIVTVPVTTLREQIGVLLPDQETLLAEAVRNAFDLDE